jgi:uncharacterized protein (DUF1697 family)
MAQYVALLRGIGPGNPNMRNEKLRGVFEKLGFANVQSVISSGNILFESDETNQTKLESAIEKAIALELGFESTTIIRSRSQLQKLVDSAPFNDLAHGPKSYLLVTFFKRSTDVKFDLPYYVDDRPYYIIAASAHDLCSVTDNTEQPTTDLMAWLEKQFSKDITSRTWLTVQRILKKLA